MTDILFFVAGIVIGMINIRLLPIAILVIIVGSLMCTVQP